MKLLFKLFVFGIFLIPLNTYAGPISLSCTSPTLNEDGSPLVDLVGIRFYESLTSGGPYTLIVDETECATSFDRPPGTYYYVATSYNAAGTESAYSNEASKTVPPTTPAPPTNLVVDPANLTVYGLSQTRNTIVAYPVGTVSENTACNSAMRFNDKYVIPFESVQQWFGTIRPEVVLAVCGAG